MSAVSVLLPCYNAAATLDEALESLARQTFPDFEIIAVDDGSTDGTADILQSWASRDPRLRLLSCRHAGIVAALNAGLQACSAPYVARMDADDRVLPERLALQVAYLDQHPEIDLVSCRSVGFPSDQVRPGFQVYIDWQNTLLDESEIRREIFVESPFPHPSVTFRRQVVLKAGGYQDLGWPEDYDLWLRLAQSGSRFAKLPEVLLEWREHPGRLTCVDKRYSLENFIRLKAHYLARGPLAGRQAVILWGAGMLGRRLSKHLVRQGLPLVAFVDIDLRKIGRSLRNLPIISPEELPGLWDRLDHPAVLVSVGARGARQIIRRRLTGFGLLEEQDWWCAG